MGILPRFKAYVNSYARSSLPREPTSAILRPLMLWPCNFCAQLSPTGGLDVPPAQNNSGSSASSGTARAIGGMPRREAEAFKNLSDRLSRKNCRENPQGAAIAASVVGWDDVVGVRSGRLAGKFALRL